MRRPVLFAIAVLALAPGIAEARQLATKPAVYTAHKEEFKAGSLKVDLVLVTPASPKPHPVLVIFASGDGGLRGISKGTLQHLADQGYYVAGFSSRDALKSIRDENGRIARHVATSSLHSLFEQAKIALKLPAATPLVVTGMSRGANMAVVVAGSPELQKGIAGGVAMALTREADYLDVPPDVEKTPGIQVDEKGRPQMYPAIQRIGSIPFAVIQSTKDSYVPSAESRQLLGPDTATRRLYEVPSGGHNFQHGEDILFRDLDDALNWIASRK
jgi:type IV secretory pathway VirJ component